MPVPAEASQDCIDVEAPAGDGRQFRGWRLLGVLFLVILATAIVSAAVDLAVIPR